MIIQIKACQQLDGEVVWCDNAADAVAFGVYGGTNGDFRWLADFRLYGDARAWAEREAKAHNAEVEDHVRAN